MAKSRTGNSLRAQKLTISRLQNVFCAMLRPHHPAGSDRWVFLVGLLLTVGLLAQSALVRPCSQKVLGGADTSDTERVVASSARAVCAAFTPATPLQAVSSERPEPSEASGGSGAPAEDEAMKMEREGGHWDGERTRMSPVLQVLRPVVLQI